MANGSSTPQERGHAAVPRDTQPSDVAEPWQSPGYWTSPPLTDPTRLTTNAVDRATAQWEQRLLSEIQIIIQRLEAMDQATKLNAEHIKSIPAEAEKDLAHAREDIDRQILALRELVRESGAGINERIEVLVREYADIPVQRERAITIARELFEARLQNVQDVATEKFHAIEGQFASNALALTAALAAQKEAAAEQNKSNTLAIAKSEQATKETIAANAAQTSGSINSQAANIADLKDRVVRLESGGVATREAQSESKSDRHSDATYVQAEAIAKAATQRATMGLVISTVVALIGIIAFVLSVAHP